MLSQYGNKAALSLADTAVSPLMLQLYFESLRSLQSNGGAGQQQQQQSPAFPSAAGAQPFPGIHPMTLSSPNFLVNSPPSASSATKNSPPSAPPTSMVKILLKIKYTKLLTIAFLFNDRLRLVRGIFRADWTPNYRQEAKSTGATYLRRFFTHVVVQLRNRPLKHQLSTERHRLKDVTVTSRLKEELRSRNAQEEIQLHSI